MPEAMASMLELSQEEADSLAMLDVYVDFKKIRGGHAETTNVQKLSVVRAEWRKTSVSPSSVHAQAAMRWLPPMR